jgi:hypothetical protein
MPNAGTQFLIHAFQYLLYLNDNGQLLVITAIAYFDSHFPFSPGAGQRWSKQKSKLDMTRAEQRTNSESADCKNLCIESSPWTKNKCQN